MLELLSSVSVAALVKGLIFAPIMMTGTTYQIARSLRFRSVSSSRLTRTYGASPTTRTKCHIHCWVKRGILGVLQSILNGYDGTSGVSSWLIFDATDALHFYFGGASSADYVTTALYRDVGAWYCIDLAVDTTQASAPNRVTLWVNGVQVTAFTAANAPAQNALHQFAYGSANNAIGSLYNGTANYLDGYLADFHFIDGTPMTAADFGQFDVNGIWQPKAYAGSYGTNGFHLDFADNSAATAAAIGKDTSGNGNNWTPNNISVTAGPTYDSMVDSPSSYGTDTGLGGEVRGNYPTLSVIDRHANATIVYAGLGLTPAVAGPWFSAGSTQKCVGKVYAECKYTSLGSGATNMFGIRRADLGNDTSGLYPGIDANSYGVFINGTNNTGTYFNGTAANAGTGGVGSILQIAFDADLGRLWFGVNNTWLGGGNPATNTTPTYTGVTLADGYRIAAAVTCTTSGQSIDVNFGQYPFAYTAPSGFKCVCTQNLPDPAIAKPSQYFNATPWISTGGVQTITGVGHQPDLIWNKSRNIVGQNNIVDTVRGVANTLVSETTAAEVSAPNFVTGVNSDGFTLGTSQYSNTNSVVAWCWKKGVLPGLEIQSYTGLAAPGTVTINHSLGVVPAMFITKARSTAAGWWVNHKGLANQTDKYLALHLTDAVATLSWGGAPTSTQVFIASGFSGQTSITQVLYMFAEVPGFSRFGSYLGNGSADGPFVWCGFRPRFVMVKRSDGIENWGINDAARDAVNPSTLGLFPSSNVAETGGLIVDFLSNGFKVRSTTSGGNVSGGTYIFAAFAENPFKYARAR